MTPERIRQITTYYERYLRLRTLPSDRGADIEHLIGMVPRLHALLDEGRIEKAMRWLGFMQGALWSIDIFSLDELKDHSRPDMPAPALRR